MSLETYINIGFALLSLVLVPIGRSLLQRLDRMETEIQTKLDETKVRQVIADKIDPINDKCDKIDDTVNKILDHIIRQKK